MRRLAFLLCALTTTLCCAHEAEPRGQLVVHVQTDLPVPRFADTLRIERLDPTGKVVDVLERLLPDRGDWPTSFGVVGERTRLRLRLFTAKRVALLSSRTSDSLLDTDQLRAEFAVDRIVDLAPPSSGLSRVVVTLSGACLGIPADLATGRSCGTRADGSTRMLDATEGITPTDRALGPADAIPVWSEAAEVPCSVTPRPDSPMRDGEVCLPGGIFFMGDVRLPMVVESPYTSIPERLVRLSPFLMDRYEMTVGRFRAAMSKGFVPPEKSYLTAADHKSCAFKDDGTRDEFPMNCLQYELAENLCAFHSSKLPSEAQWEYAASGRGQERMYPWGDAPEPSCAAATYARWHIDGAAPALGQRNECDTGTLPPIRVAERDGLPGYLDVTLDGVHGMAGSVSEWVQDAPSRYDQPCWTRNPLPRDPICTEPGAEMTGHSYRGASWLVRAANLAVARRFYQTGDPNDLANFLGPYVGFRCVRPGKGP